MQQALDLLCPDYTKERNKRESRPLFCGLAPQYNKKKMTLGRMAGIKDTRAYHEYTTVSSLPLKLCGSDRWLLILRVDAMENTSKKAASLLWEFYRDPLRSLTLSSLNVSSQKS